MSTTAPQTRHAVTALIVAHDGARLLPGLIQALAAQTYPVEQTVGVDTGSQDRSGAVLAELIGQDAVVGMHRSTGYGEAVAVALRHATRRRPETTDPNLRRVEWIWLLHDDCEPAPDALERLLRAASRDRSVVVVGPKVLDGQDRRTLREAGVSIDRAGRRVTGIDPGEIDQGQHDHKRAVLAVGSAGMLVRRDVWDRLGGFDPGLKLFRDDVDFCWRVQAAGLRVQVATDAVLYHWELAARRRRPTGIGSVRRLDRRNALFVLAANLPLPIMLWVVGRCIVGSLIRAAYFLLTKQLDLSAAYALSVLELLAHPVRLVRARGRRAAGLAEGYYAVRSFIPPARTLSRLAEKVAGLVSSGPPQASGGRHQATAEEPEEDAQFVDQPSVVRRVIGHPGVQLFAALLITALIAERRLLGTSPLGGGTLVPAWGGAGALWQEYLAGFHAVSVGSTASAPPYLAVVAGLATLLGGQAWLAVDVLLLGCVPLAGLTAYLAARWLVTATPARVLLAASYALLPVAAGAVAAGRLGTAVAFVLLPLAAVSAGRMLTAAPRQARRAAWAAGLLIAVASAFAPLAWVLGAVFAIGALAARRWLVAVNPVNAAIVAVTPFFVLFPWSLHLLTSPSALLSEAGVSAPGLTTRGLPATALLALSPGGPGLPPAWVTTGFGLALFALVLPVRRTGLVIAGWAVAVAGFAAAVAVSRISVTPPAGGQPADGWPGVATALAALGLLVASAPAAQWLAGIIPNEGRLLSPAASSSGPRYGRPRRLLAGAALAAAATAPALAAAYWIKDGVQGPVGTVAAPLLPAFVSAASASDQQYRTLVLRPDGTRLDYLVVRQQDPFLGEPELDIAPGAQEALSRQVAALGAPDGADAGDPGLVLGSFGIRWVLLPGPVDPVLAQRLDAALGLVALNKGSSYDLWQVAGSVGRVRVVANDGATTVLPSNAVNVSAASAPAAGGTLILAEPYGGWTATLNGHPLKPAAAPVNGWAQGFVLPPGGGHLSITRNNAARTVSLIAELIATLAVCLLALPGKRADPVEEAQALAALREARNGRRAASPTRHAVLRGAGAGHRAAGGADLLRFVRDRRAGQAEAGPAPASPVSPTPVPAGRMLAAQALAGHGEPTDQVPADGEPADGEPADGEPAGRQLTAGAAWYAQTTAVVPAEPVTAADLANWGQDGRDGIAAGPGPGASPAAPWDVAGDWAGASPIGASNAWTADPLDTSTPLPQAGRWSDPAWADAPPWQAGPARAQTPGRPTGQDTAAPEPAAPGSVWPERPASTALSSQPQPQPGAGRPDGPVRGDAPPWQHGPSWGDFAGRLTDQRAAMPEPAVPERTGPERTGPERTGPERTGPDSEWAKPLGSQSPAAQPVPEAGRRPDPVQRDAPPWETDPAWEDFAARPAGQRAAAPERGVPEPPVPERTGPERTGPERTVPERTGPGRTGPGRTGPERTGPGSVWPEPPAAENPVSQSRAPWETGPRRARESGPQRAVSTAGAQPGYPRESGPQAPVTSAGGQPVSGTGTQPVSWTGAQPASPGPLPVSGAGARPVPPAETQPAQRAPWETGDWDAVPGGEAAIPAEPAPEPEAGSGASPVTSRPAKPERHSHRAGKHGRPSRWRGPGTRSSGDGGS